VIPHWRFWSKRLTPGSTPRHLGSRGAFEEAAEVRHDAGYIWKTGSAFMAARDGLAEQRGTEWNTGWETRLGAWSPDDI
jgi:hypothetical protein